MVWRVTEFLHNDAFVNISLEKYPNQLKTFDLIDVGYL